MWHGRTSFSLRSSAQSGTSRVPQLVVGKSSGEKTSKTRTMGDEIIGTGWVTLAELMVAGDGDDVVVKLVLTDPATKTKAERDAGSVTLSGAVA